MLRGEFPRGISARDDRDGDRPFGIDKRIEVLEGYLAVFLNLDKVIKIITPTIDGLAIAAALDADFLKGRGGPAQAAAAILAEAGFPPLAAMSSAEWSGTLPLTRSTRPLASTRVFLVGDAAGYVEPFTGQGMAIALQGAFALAPHVQRAIEGWSPEIAEAWSRDYSRNVGKRHWPAALVAAIVRRPALASFALGLAASLPALPGVIVRAVNRPVLTRLS